MRLLDRYLLRELLLPLTYCVVGFLMCLVTFDVINELSSFQKNRLTVSDIIEYYGHKVPELLTTNYALPVSLLLALLYALTNHARHHELTAIRAAGVSLWRISLPYFLVGLVLSGVVLVLNEHIVPDSSDAAESVMLRRITNPARAAEKLWRRNVVFANPTDRRTWQIGAYHLQRRLMVNPQLDWHMPDGTRHQIFAERARWLDHSWVFTNVQEFVFSSPTNDVPDKFTHSTLVLPDPTETPRLIKSEIKISDIDSLRSLRKTQLSALGILEYLRLHPLIDRRRDDTLRTMLHSRLAAPWVCVVVVLIAVPFGALPGRRNVFVGVASSIFICFVYLVTKDLTLALGSGGYVPAWVAAWAPNIVFASTGALLMWRQR